jgi:hypothetical protein
LCPDAATFTVAAFLHLLATPTIPMLSLLFCVFSLFAKMEGHRAELAPEPAIRLNEIGET